MSAFLSNLLLDCPALDSPAVDTLTRSALSARVDTRRVTNRRRVAFSSFDEFLTDAGLMASQPVYELGNWTLAQIFDHLARSMTVCVEGTRERFPLPLRVALRLARRRIISNPLWPGYNVPENVAALLRPDPNADLGESLQKMEAAARRFEATTVFPTHPGFGRLTRDEFRALALHHADLHLSFIVPAYCAEATISSDVLRA